MNVEPLVEMLLERITAEPDSIDPQATKIEGENVIAVEDNETGALFFVTVEEA